MLNIYLVISMVLVALGVVGAAVVVVGDLQVVPAAEDLEVLDAGPVMGSLDKTCPEQDQRNGQNEFLHFFF